MQLDYNQTIIAKEMSGVFQDFKFTSFNIDQQRVEWAVRVVKISQRASVNFDEPGVRLS